MLPCSGWSTQNAESAASDDARLGVELVAPGRCLQRPDAAHVASPSPYDDDNDRHQDEAAVHGIRDHVMIRDAAVLNVATFVVSEGPHSNNYCSLIDR